MKRLPVIAITLSTGLAACANTTDLEPLNLEPSTLEEAELVLGELDARLVENPNDPEALESMRALQPTLDALNGLVARLEPEPGHVVSFYEYAPGAIGIQETHPDGTRPLIADRPELAGLPADDVYRELSGEDDVPNALLEASRREVASDVAPPAELPGPSGPEGLESDVGVTRAALGSNGAYFRDNYCFTQGDVRLCYPNWANGGYAQSITRTSFFTIAPYSGHVSLRFMYEGVTRFVQPVYQGEVQSHWMRSAQPQNCMPNPWPWTGEFCFPETLLAWHRWDILYASGDSFHWTYAARWSCDYQTCDYWPL